MDNSYIKDLKSRIEQPAMDANQADNALANLSGTVGWDILKESIENRIHALLQPGVDKTQDLAFIGAVTMARELAIEVLQSVIDEVETTRISLNEQKKNQPVEVSEPEAL